MQLLVIVVSVVSSILVTLISHDGSRNAGSPMARGSKTNSTADSKENRRASVWVKENPWA